MAKHAAAHVGRRSGRRTAWLALLMVAVAAAVLGVVIWRVGDTSEAHRTAGSGATNTTAPSGAGKSSDCPRTLTAVTAASFAPVLTGLAAPLAAGADCVSVRVRAADGRGAAAIVASSDADVWVPDDLSWPKLPSAARLASTLPTGQRRVIASSPVYFVTQHAGPALPGGARSWLGLARTLAGPGPWHLVLRNPADSGDAMAGAGGLADAVLATDGPLVSALDLMRVWQAGTTLTGSGPGLPQRTGQVGLVPEYALLASGHAADYTITAPTDGTMLLRYAWFPSAAAAANPARAQLLARLYAALTSPAAATALSKAGLRGPDWPGTAPAGAAQAGLPAAGAAPMDAISEHFMYHVLSTWNPALRTATMLAVIDVSGSMADPAPGTGTAKIALVRQGLTQVAALLPDTARLGLWQFGSQLNPPQDWQSLVAPAPLTRPQRAAIAAATARLTARPTGTGLYDTILAAYRYAQAHYQPGIPNEVVIFTDGVNQDDPESISLTALRAGLAAADPGKRVQLSVFGLGGDVPAATLSAAVQPVGGQVDQLTSPQEVIGAFVHAVSGALSGVPG